MSGAEASNSAGAESGRNPSSMLFMNYRIESLIGDSSKLRENWAE
jgi:hypothetical protein